MKNITFVIFIFLYGISSQLVLGASKIKLGDVPEKNPEKSPKQAPFLTEETPKPSTKETPDPLEDNYQLIRDVTEEFYQKGLNALEAGDLGAAEAYFDRVLVIKPTHKGAQLGIESIMNAYEDAKPDPVQEDPKYALIRKLQNKLVTAFDEENYEEAVNLANEVLAIDPDNKLAKQKLATSSRKLYGQTLERAQAREDEGDLQGAIDVYKLAIGYGKDLSLKTKIAELRSKIADRNKNHAAELYLQALYASQEGKTKEAIDLCRQALAMDPKNIQAQRMIERLKPLAVTPTP